jgi:hypothetical protein
LVFALAACAGPNRTEPSFVVRPEVRSALPIALPEQASVDHVNSSCGDHEVARAKAALGAVARELGKGGFQVVPLTPEPDADDPPPAPVLTSKLTIRLEDCDRGLFGDVAFEVMAGGESLATFAESDRFFSNVAVLGAELVDRLARSPEVAAFAAAQANAIATSSVSR